MNEDNERLCRVFRWTVEAAPEAVTRAVIHDQTQTFAREGVNIWNARDEAIAHCLQIAADPGPPWPKGRKNRRLTPEHKRIFQGDDCLFRAGRGAREAQDGVCGSEGHARRRNFIGRQDLIGAALMLEVDLFRCAAIDVGHLFASWRAAITKEREIRS